MNIPIFTYRYHYNWYLLWAKQFLKFKAQEAIHLSHLMNERFGVNSVDIAFDFLLPMIVAVRIYDGEDKNIKEIPYIF